MASRNAASVARRIVPRETRRARVREEETSWSFSGRSCIFGL
jgi:hypothetical protein